MIKKFCTSCGYAALAECIFCEECGVAFDSSVDPQNSNLPSGKLNPFASLYDFVKGHIAVVNGVVLFSGTVVGVLDFCLPVLKPMLITLYWMTGVLSVLMLLAAVFPTTWLNLIAKLGYNKISGKYTMTPLHQRDAWRGAIVLLTGVTAAGVVSLAKANQGGALASSFPSLRTFQESLLSLNQKADQIQMGVKDANSKLDRIAKSIDPENSAERCSDLDCAVHGGASKETLEKLWKAGSRLPLVDSNTRDVLTGVLTTKRQNRLETLDFLYDHSIPQEFKISPVIWASASLSPKGLPLMKQMWKAADLNRRTRYGKLVQGGDESITEWNEVASCIDDTEGGISLIQFAALIADDELFNHLLSRGVKMPTQPISCKWKDGFDIPAGTPGKFLSRAITRGASILFSPLGAGQVVTLH